MAFGQLFQCYERYVFAVATSKTEDFNDAQELVQEVFIKAMDKISQLRQSACFGS